MKLYDFTLVLDGVPVMTDEIASALYEAGCDDGSPGSSGGASRVTLHREAASLEDAIRSGLADVARAGYAVSRVEIDGEDLAAWSADAARTA